MTTQRSLYERIFQVVLFEGLAIGIFSPVLSWVVDKPLGETTVLTIAISVTAMVWGFAFNSFFGILISHASNKVQKWKRVIHALGFETGLVLIAVPLSAWWLQMTFVEALLMDLGLLLVFLPYTFCFYWAYDMLRQRLVKAPLRRSPLVPHKTLVAERRSQYAPARPVKTTGP
ncbi:PACE efflux transporter [Caballeronia sordidicola]|uniref:PACE efflux transporter n=1 Tax=Caballeronia sordidicola TaxID=196367 RepID=UPI00068B0399|nr:PACE efflux transporter [Caballeronia sordidicola]